MTEQRFSVAEIQALARLAGVDVPILEVERRGGAVLLRLYGGETVALEEKSADVPVSNSLSSKGKGRMR